MLMEYGEVLTEHVGDASLTHAGEDGPSDEAIYGRDMAWLAEADIVVAEVTVPSHGIGYEVAWAGVLGKPVLCLHRRGTERRLSAILTGSPTLQCEHYNSVEELRLDLTGFREIFCVKESVHSQVYLSRKTVAKTCQVLSSTPIRKISWSVSDRAPWLGQRPAPATFQMAS